VSYWPSFQKLYHVKLGLPKAKQQYQTIQDRTMTMTTDTTTVIQFKNATSVHQWSYSS